jgi:hypothetical protein
VLGCIRKRYKGCVEGRGFNPAANQGYPLTPGPSPAAAGEGCRRRGEGAPFGGTKVPPFRIHVTRNYATKR